MHSHTLTSHSGISLKVLLLQALCQSCLWEIRSRSHGHVVLMLKCSPERGWNVAMAAVNHSNAQCHKVPAETSQQRKFTCSLSWEQASFFPNRCIMQNKSPWLNRTLKFSLLATECAGNRRFQHPCVMLSIFFRIQWKDVGKLWQLKLFPEKKNELDTSFVFTPYPHGLWQCPFTN